MHRLIKFRAWSDDLKSMGMPFEPFDYEFMASGGTFPLGTVFMQFTGIKDKNGNEIYEGDVVILTDLDDESTHTTYVKWMDGGFTLEWDYAFEDGSDITLIGWATEYVSVEVIGNIFENADLLK